MANEDKPLSVRFAELQAEYGLLKENTRVLEQQYIAFCDSVQDAALSLAIVCGADKNSEAIKQAVRLGLMARDKKLKRFFEETNIRAEAGTGDAEADAYDLRSLHVDTDALNRQRPDAQED